MQFDRLLFISCLCIVVALVLYFFHWNRFLGFLIGHVIRLLYWSEDASSIWVEIGSIHFSLIAGRILLKDISYYSSNQTIRVVKGQIQWRYWIRRPTSEEELGSHLGGEGQSSARSLHCRIHVSLQGFEWFLYNRTAAFDVIMSQMEANNLGRPVSRSTDRRRSFQKAPHGASSPNLYPPLTKGTFPIPSGARNAIAWINSQLPNLDPKDLLPLSIEVTKGAITCGNSSTPNLLLAEFQRTEGTFGVVESRSKFDLYKQTLSLKFQHVLFRYVENEDYVDPMTSLGELVHGRIIQHSALSRTSTYLSYRAFTKLWERLNLFALVRNYTLDRRKLHAAHKQQINSHYRSRMKTHKSAEEPTPIGADFTLLEYAIQRRILEAPVLELIYYCDVVGEVPAMSEQRRDIGAEPIDVGNGDVSPEWGFSITVTSGLIRYGPWADRQRAELQRAFFPSIYHDGEETIFLKPGDKRIWTAMQIFIELRDSTALHIPFREPSKDWQWDGKGNLPPRQRVREPALIRLTAGDRSSISYALPMVTGPSGYQPTLEVQLDTVVVTSSLNDIQLVTADSCNIHCELPTPLKWKVERTWSVTVSLFKPVLYLIRDHINMFTDLGRDWTMGPPSDYQRFIPMVYAFRLELHHYDLNTYVNDHNLIDKPLIRDENALLTAQGAYLETKAHVFSNKYRPESITIPFNIEAPDISFSLSLPRWNTNALHAPKEGSNLAMIRSLHTEGSYQYFSEVREEHVEQLKLRFTLHDIAYKALGWSIRYFMVARDNYFGSFTHFTTLYEYLDKRKQKLPLGDPIMAKYRRGKANLLQVEMKLFVERGTIILPAGLPGYESSSESDAGIGACVIAHVPNFQLQLRIHDYYMDMSLNISPISGGIVFDYPEKVTYAIPALKDLKDILFIDGIDITANRLFGPQPRTATYVCIWEIRLGHIKSLLTASHGRLIVAAMNAFRLNFADLPNAPAKHYLSPVEPDVTFVKISVSSVDIIWRAGRAALSVSFSHGMAIDSNDLGGRYHKKVTSLRVPQICVKALLTTSVETCHWWEAAEVTADAYMDIYTSPQGYRDMTRAQITYVEEQDRPTGRARQMLNTLQSEGIDTSSKLSGGLYLPHPLLPLPRNHTQPLQQVPEHRPPRLHPSSIIAQLSDSDAEERISEADRDARLAKTRSSTPIVRLAHEEDQTMSGDESDDEDLTDSSSDSDWSDLARQNVMHYSQITRRYIARHLGLPRLWDGSPFVLVRDRTPRVFSPSFPNYIQTADIPVDFRRSLNINDDLDTTSFRLKCISGVRVKITPLILSAAVHFEDDVKRNPLGAELCIDSMLASHLSSMSPSGAADVRTFFEFSVPWVTIHVLQRIIITDSRSTMSPTSSETSEENNPSGLGVITVAQGKFQGIQASGVSMKGRMNVKTRFSSVSFMLDNSVEKRFTQPPHSDDVAFSCIVSGMKADIVEDHLDINWKKSTVSVGHLGPEYVAATSIALSRNMEQLATISRRWNQHSSIARQNTVFSVIRFSGEKATFDPLSTIQPSYLIQSGTPHTLRTDTAFKFFFHLRNCLWYLRAEKYDISDSSEEQVAPINAEDFRSLLEKRLVGLDPDTYNVAYLSSLEGFFPILRLDDSSIANSLRSSITSVSIRISQNVIVVLDPKRISPSELLMTELYARVHIHRGEVRIFPSHQTSIPRTFPKDKHTHGIKKVTVSVALGVVTLSVFPHLISFAQHVLQVQRSYRSTTLREGALTPSLSVSVIPEDFGLLSLDIIFSLRRLRIQAAAENLVFEFGVSKMHGVSSSLQGWQNGNHSVLFNEIYVHTRSPGDLTKESDQDILASVGLAEGRVNIISRQDIPSHRLVFATSIRLSVPRSALRLYRFVEEWTADYLPGIEVTVRDILSELQPAPVKDPSRAKLRSSSRSPNFQVQGKLPHIGISLQVMHGTWLSWEARSTLGYFNFSDPSTPSIEYTFGLQVEAMALSISSNPNQLDVEPSIRVELVLPPMSATGQYSGSIIHTVTSVEFVEFKVKPSHWDTLLVVQQKFGQDFNDLVTLVQETRQRRTALGTSKLSDKPKIPVQHTGSLKIQGCRVGLEGLSSTIYLDCLDIGGGIDNHDGLAWNINLSDLAFSLAPRAAVGLRFPGFNRNHRSAFVIVDFEASARKKLVEEWTGTVVQLSVTKIHAVMQPSSIGEVGDFIDYLQAEMLERQEQRALELAAFKEKAHSILKTFEVGMRDTYREQRSWLENYIIDISARNIGVAFPLTHDPDLELPKSQNRDSSPVPAFLWSIKSIQFGTHRGETGQAIMKSFSFQFIPRFRQSISSDFSGENHQTRNRLIYPEMEAQLRSPHTASSRHIWLGANVSGFILDLDSNIPSYVFSLIDVYRQGKERVERLSASIPHTLSTMEIENSVVQTASIERRYTTLPTSNIFGSLTFLSGKVRVYRSSASSSYRTRFSYHHQEPSDEQVIEVGAEVFNLPIVSVWAEYRATPASQKLSTVPEPEPSILMFKATLHSSQNTLRPTLLPFLTEFVSHMETRLRKVSSNIPHVPSITLSEPPAVVGEQEVLDFAVSSIRISFSLRIDRSRLELTCQPDVNVIAGLHWDSGGFIVNISPGIQNVTITGSVGGLTLGLKHGFLSEDCVKLDARNLVFSVTFSKVDSDQGPSVGSLSAILDTEFLGVVRFSRLQDVLCFKAVWLDRIPVFYSQSAVATKTLSRSPESSDLHSQPNKQELTTVVLVRIRQITLEIDLGQSISSMTLDLSESLIRTKLTRIVNEASIFVADLAIIAKGNIAGHAHVPNCLFQTVRSTEGNSTTPVGRNRMLDLRMTSGPLVLSLESDHQKLLHYRAEPLEVRIFDDWSVMLPLAEERRKPLQLSFTIICPEITAVVTVGTIPRLLAYFNKFESNIDAQRQGASRESKAFRIALTPKPDNPLSAVAEAMLHSARSRFKEAEDGLPYVIRQHMSVQFSFLRLIVFPRTMDDLEIAQFIGRDVRAHLDRFAESESSPGIRDLLLSFSSMTISKFTGLGHPQSSNFTDGRDWLASLLTNSPEAIIVGLPSMTMHMVSEELINNQETTLVYDFDSKFVRQEGKRELEDIYISLNVALYSWLTLLRKNLTREMDQARASTDWRAFLHPESSNVGAGRKQAPDPLRLTDPPQSPAMHTDASSPFSPFSPTTALKLSTERPLRTLSATSSTLASPGSSHRSQTFPSSMGVLEAKPAKRSQIIYQPRDRQIERLRMRQLGEATPDVMHPFFMKKAGFNLEDSLPQYVDEYATTPLEQIMEVLLKLYSRQLLSGRK